MGLGNRKKRCSVQPISYECEKKEPDADVSDYDRNKLIFTFTVTPTRLRPRTITSGAFAGARTFGMAPPGAYVNHVSLPPSSSVLFL